MANSNSQTNRPADTAFKQQRLKSWQPLLTPKNVIPIFFIIGIIFLPIGIALYVSSESVKEIILDYTDCKKGSSATLPVATWAYDQQERKCTMKFELDNFKKPVYLYYRLTNFYQNHRDYFKSYDAKQYKSEKPLSLDEMKKSTCNPLAVNGTKQIYPCGLVANSFFSDEIVNSQIVNLENDSTYVFTEKGISWSSDKDKFKNMQVTDEELKSIVPPPNWQKDFPQYKDGYTRENFPKLADMERFQVWMRVAGLPNFRKLYGQNKDMNIVKGNYTIEVIDRFDVDSFGGTKSIIISNVSAFGGKNPFLGIGYIVVGTISLILGLIFLIKNMINPRKLGDTSYLSYKTE